MSRAGEEEAEEHDGGEIGADAVGKSHLGGGWSLRDPPTTK